MWSFHHSDKQHRGTPAESLPVWVSVLCTETRLMRVYEMGARAPLYTCRGRAVGLLHVWQGRYAMTVSGYGKRV